jgi:hypothetical protein
LVNAKDFGNPITTYKDEFPVECLPADEEKTSKVTGCDDPADNLDGCADTYAEVLSKTPATGAWNGGNAKKAINEYITKCPSTSCKATCLAVISEKNVGARYSNLRTKFEAECNPVPPTPPGEDGSLTGYKTSISLIGISALVAFIQLLHFN